MLITLVSASRRICRRDVDPGGLESTSGLQAAARQRAPSVMRPTPVYRSRVRSGTRRCRDSRTTVIVEDGGVLVNPMIVDGQIYGGLAQGIGTAL